eukprot:Phypoly_transcript_04153.p1 GENE.Phypoly_transcript_04153~~Phypoly_transcript_04153.p1  ORF type:complete len:700 (+),score=103.93 Phypoly_transcript_04153:77-2176(+)
MLRLRGGPLSLASTISRISITPTKPAPLSFRVPSSVPSFLSLRHYTQQPTLNKSTTGNNGKNEYGGWNNRTHKLLAVLGGFGLWVGLDRYRRYSCEEKEVKEVPKEGKEIDFKKKKKKKNIAVEKADVSRFWRDVFLPELPLIILSILATIASTMIGLRLPGLFGELMDKARGNLLRHTDILKALGVLILQGVVQFGYTTLVSFAAERMVSRLKNRLFAIVLAQDVEFFDKFSTGDLLSRLTADPESIRSAFKHTVTMGVRSVGQIIGGVAQLYIISKDLTLLMLVIVPAVVGIGTIYTRFLKSVSLKARNAAAQASFVATEVISNVRTVKAFTGESFEKKRFSEKVKDSLYLSERMGVFLGVLQGLSTIALQGIGLFVYWYGGMQVAQGTLTAGALTSFMLHTSFLQSSLQHLSMLMGQVVGAFGSASRIIEIAEISPKIGRKRSLSQNIKLPNVKGVIELRNVNFSYPSRENHQVLSNFSLTLQPGKVLALAGPSGSGKSTISTLLQRFYDPQSGEVMLDGVPLRVLDPTWLRSLIGVVSQEPILFATSIVENIAYGRPGATREEIIDAAKKAYAHDFISSFPQGYNTVVGERGVQLSGGQRQRIAIARAILKNPRILILDEATSALDAESESQVQAALQSLMRGRTVLVIAHRLSTVQNADTIAVVVGGQIVEMGKHSELMQKGGVYSHLVIKQMQ